MAREEGDVTIASGGNVWVLDGVKKVEDSIMMVLGEATGLVGEVMLAVWGEQRVLDGVKVVGKVVMVLNGVILVLGEEVGLSGEGMLGAGGDVVLLDAVMIVLAGVVMILDRPVVMVCIGVTSEMVRFVWEVSILEEDLSVDVDEEDWL